MQCEIVEALLWRTYTATETLRYRAMGGSFLEAKLDG